MDATENDLPPSVPFQVSGFPTLKFKKAGSREFIDYEGDRSLDSLIEFVETHAANPLDKSVPFKGKHAESTPTESSKVAQPTEDAHDHDHDPCQPCTPRLARLRSSFIVRRSPFTIRRLPFTAPPFVAST